jgi:hypothetical protein
MQMVSDAAPAAAGGTLVPGEGLAADANHRTTMRAEREAAAPSSIARIVAEPPARGWRLAASSESSRVERVEPGRRASYWQGCRATVNETPMPFQVYVAFTFSEPSNRTVAVSESSVATRRPLVGAPQNCLVIRTFVATTLTL